MKFAQVDIVPYYFVVGSHEPGNHHGMGDCLVVRGCHFYLHTLSLVFGADLDCNSCRNSITLLIHIYSLLRPLWQATLSFEGKGI